MGQAMICNDQKSRQHKPRPRKHQDRSRIRRIDLEQLLPDLDRRRCASPEKTADSRQQKHHLKIRQIQPSFPLFFLRLILYLILYFPLHHFLPAIPFFVFSRPHPQLSAHFPAAQIISSPAPAFLLPV